MIRQPVLVGVRHRPVQVVRVDIVRLAVSVGVLLPLHDVVGPVAVAVLVQPARPLVLVGVRAPHRFGILHLGRGRDPVVVIVGVPRVDELVIVVVRRIREVDHLHPVRQPVPVAVRGRRVRTDRQLVPVPQVVTVAVRQVRVGAVELLVRVQHRVPVWIRRRPVGVVRVEVVRRLVPVDVPVALDLVREPISVTVLVQPRRHAVAVEVRRQVGRLAHLLRRQQPVVVVVVVQRVDEPVLVGVRRRGHAVRHLVAVQQPVAVAVRHARLGPDRQLYPGGQPVRIGVPVEIEELDPQGQLRRPQRRVGHGRRQLVPVDQPRRLRHRQPESLGRLGAGCRVRVAAAPRVQVGLAPLDHGRDQRHRLPEPRRIPIRQIHVDGRPRPREALDDQHAIVRLGRLQEGRVDQPVGTLVHVPVVVRRDTAHPQIDAEPHVVAQLVVPHDHADRVPGHRHPGAAVAHDHVRDDLRPRRVVELHPRPGVAQPRVLGADEVALDPVVGGGRPVDQHPGPRHRRDDHVSGARPPAADQVVAGPRRQRDPRMLVAHRPAADGEADLVAPHGDPCGAGTRQEDAMHPAAHDPIAGAGRQPADHRRPAVHDDPVLLVGHRGRPIGGAADQVPGDDHPAVDPDPVGVAGDDVALTRLDATDQDARAARQDTVPAVAHRLRAGHVEADEVALDDRPDHRLVELHPAHGVAADDIARSLDAAADHGREALLDPDAYLVGHRRVPRRGQPDQIASHHSAVVASRGDPDARVLVARDDVVQDQGPLAGPDPDPVSSVHHGGRAAGIGADAVADHLALVHIGDLHAVGLVAGDQVARPDPVSHEVAVRAAVDRDAGLGVRDRGQPGGIGADAIAAEQVAGGLPAQDLHPVGAVAAEHAVVDSVVRALDLDAAAPVGRRDGAAGVHAHPAGPDLVAAPAHQDPVAREARDDEAPHSRSDPGQLEPHPGRDRRAVEPQGRLTLQARLVGRVELSGPHHLRQRGLQRHVPGLGRRVPARVASVEGQHDVVLALGQVRLLDRVAQGARSGVPGGGHQVRRQPGRRRGGRHTADQEQREEQPRVARHWEASPSSSPPPRAHGLRDGVNPTVITTRSPGEPTARESPAPAPICTTRSP